MANSGAAVLRIDQDITGFGHFMRFIYYKKKTNVLLLIITNQHGKSCGVGTTWRHPGLLSCPPEFKLLIYSVMYLYQIFFVIVISVLWFCWSVVYMLHLSHERSLLFLRFLPCIHPCYRIFFREVVPYSGRGVVRTENVGHWTMWFLILGYINKIEPYLDLWN